MTMRTPPIALENYFLTELTLTANKDFDPEKAADLDLKSFKVTPAYLPDERISGTGRSLFAFSISLARTLRPHMHSRLCSPDFSLSTPRSRKK
jgi:hypothetical protein